MLFYEYHFVHVVLVYSTAKCFWVYIVCVFSRILAAIYI